MTNEERAHKFWVELVPQIQMVGSFYGIDGKQNVIDALKKAFDAVRLDEAEWWNNHWGCDETSQRIAALREGRGQ